MNGVAPLAQPRSAVLLAIGASRDLGERIARRAAIPLVDYEEEIFPDGERKIGPAEDVAGRTVLALHSLHARQEDETGGVGDQLLRLLLLIGALKDAGAARVIALTPYLALARQDRRTANGEPVSSRYVAILLQAMGIDAIAALDVHNVSAFENAFSCPSRALSAVPLFVGHFAVQLRGRATDQDDDDAKERPILVLSPDAGGIKRARGFQQRLAGALERPVELGLMDKRRDGDGETFAGSAEGAVAIIIDDMISGGTTLARAAAVRTGYTLPSPMQCSRPARTSGLVTRSWTRSSSATAFPMPRGAARPSATGCGSWIARTASPVCCCRWRRPRPWAAPAASRHGQ